MLVGGDFEFERVDDERLPLDTFDRVTIAVLCSFPLMAAARLLGEAVAWLS